MRAKNQKDVRRNNHQYMRGVWFIALNDDPGSSDAMNPEIVAELISVVTLAEAFQIDSSIIASDVIEVRKEKNP